MSLLDSAQSAALRKPFAPEVIGKLPRIWCRNCNSREVCKDHTKAKCAACKQNITTAHLHLDYVGHAEITDRLIEVDPYWGWEPVAFDADGLPKFDANGGLWIRLTVGNVSRLGYGDSQGKQGPNAVKEAIGDALRNAAMRFGVGLDLWGATYKGDEAEREALEEKQAQQMAEYAQGIYDEISNAKNRNDFSAAWTRTNMAVDKQKITPEKAQELLDFCKTRGDAVLAQKVAEKQAEDAKPASSPPTEAMIKRLYAELGNFPAIANDRETRLALFTDVCGFPVSSTKDLSADEVKAIVFRLADMKQKAGTNA